MSREKRTRRVAASAVAVALAASLAAGATLAYLSSRDEVANVYSIAVAQTEIVEDFQPPAEIRPGESFPKVVQIANTGSAEVYVRVFCEVADPSSRAWAALDYDTTRWSAPQDGYWYLTVPLPAGESIGFTELVTLPVFEQVSGPDGYAWGPLSGQEDPVLWTTPSPDPGDDPSLMAYSTGEGAALRSTITVEALQAEAVSPDFASESPWGGVTAWPAIYTYDVGA